MILTGNKQEVAEELSFDPVLVEGDPRDAMQVIRLAKATISKMVQMSRSTVVVAINARLLSVD